MNYEALKPFLEAAIEGYVASDRGQFMPNNPYAQFGIQPGMEDKALMGAAWFFGYWERAYCRNGEEGVFK
jgi:hypothetical protein